MSDLKQTLIKTALNAVAFEVKGRAKNAVGCTRFGGLPDVPADFKWPYFSYKTYYDETVKPRPLNFLMQVNLEEVAPLDKDNLLPKKGLLSFFHAVESDYYPDEHEGVEEEECLKVFYFEDVSNLKKAAEPDGFTKDDLGIMPPLNIKMQSKLSYMDFEDYFTAYNCDYDLFDEYEEVYKSLNGGEERDPQSKLLGWADIIQNSIYPAVELNAQGYKICDSEDFSRLSKQYDEAAKNSLFDWVLLLQLDPVYDGDFELMYGDGGSLYVYIRREDLLSRRFEKARFTIQCY